MVRLGYCFGAADLGLTLAALKAHGFFPRAADQGMGLTVTHYTTAIGGMAIHVPPDQAVDAANLLADFPPPVQNRPGLLACAVILLGFFMSFAPPPASGLYLRRIRPADDVVST